MNRNNWEKDFFAEYSSTQWVCHECGAGSLMVREQPDINNSETFTAHLICSGCRKEYACNGFVRYFAYGNPVSKFYEGKQKRFYPTSFTPCLRLFHLNKSIPSEISVEIDCSFNTFWSDASSSANAIRRSLEILLEKQGVPRASSLHHRIAMFSKNKNLEKLLTAIKIVGNSGSHGQPLAKTNLMDAYDILEYCLNELYPDPDKVDVYKIADMINKTKRASNNGHPFSKL